MCDTFTQTHALEVFHGCNVSVTLIQAHFLIYLPAVLRRGEAELCLLSMSKVYLQIADIQYILVTTLCVI